MTSGADVDPDSAPIYLVTSGPLVTPPVQLVATRELLLMRESPRKTLRAPMILIRVKGNLKGDETRGARFSFKC